MKKFYFIFLALIVIGKIQAQSFVTVPQRVVNIDDHPTLLEVVSNGSWTAESNQPWLKVSLSGSDFNSASSTSKIAFKASSATTSLLWFSAATNTVSVSRSAIIRLTAMGGNSIDITVNQQMRIPRTNVSVDTVVLQDEYAYLPVTTNASFTATSNDAWLNVSLSYFDKESRSVTFNAASSTMTLLFFRAASNTTSSLRIGTVTLKTEGGSSQTLRVMQWGNQGNETQFFVSRSAIKIVNSMDAVQYYSNRTCTITSNSEWLQVGLSGANYAQTSQTVTTYTNTGSNDFIVLSAATNTTNVERSAEVIITTDLGQERKITVYQAANLPVLNISESAISVKNDAHAVIIESNLSWKAQSSQEWLKVGLSGTHFGTNTSTIYWDERTSYSVLWFKAQTNTTNTSRVATITIESKAGLSKTITVSQDPNQTLIEVSTPTVDFVEKENKPIIITITASVEWYAVSDQNWLTTEKIDKRGTSSLSLSATPNTTAEARIGKIYIKSMSGDTLQIIAVTQAAGAGTPTPEFATSALSLYPNPTVKHFAVNAAAHVEVYSLLGELQLSQKASANEDINIDALPSGVYIVKLVTANGTSQLKITKQ